MYLAGFRIFDRKKLEQDKANQNKQRLFGFDSSSKESPVSSPIKMQRSFAKPPDKYWLKDLAPVEGA